MELLLGFVIPAIVLIAVLFLSYRLKFFADEGVPGRYFFLFGGIMLVTVSFWQAVSDLSQYGDWFLEGVYPVLDIVQLVLFVGGASFIVIGLAFYADFWQVRKEELAARDERLSILGNLQRDAREPYQLMELMEIALKQIVSSLSDTSGAVFLVNRRNRQFVLTSAAGLTKQETALLEHYPLERNIVSQSVEQGQPIISGKFDLNRGDRSGGESRFESCLVLPLISGTEPIGGIILLSEVGHNFSQTDIRVLAPAAEWLAEKIKSARLGRELSLVGKDKDALSARYADLTARMMTASASFAQGDMIESFCRSLVGLLGSQSVNLCGMKSGSFTFFGGSEPLTDISENFRTALIDALGRNKPLIINQEAAGEQNRTYIARSTLVYPLPDGSSQNAMLFIRESGAFKLGEGDLKTVDLYAGLAGLALRQNDMRRLDITRRRGLEKVLQLLRFDDAASVESDPGSFVAHLANILPSKSRAIAFARNENGSYRATAGHRVDPGDMDDFDIMPGEGIIGEAAAGHEAKFISGRSNVNEAVQSFDQSNRDAFQRIFGESDLPGLLAACPVGTAEGIEGVVLFFLFDVNESEKGEWQRLLTLAAGLYSVRLTIAQLHQTTPVVPAAVDTEFWGEAINRLNNHLSAIIGNAELASIASDLSGETVNHFKSIISEAEQAAKFGRRLMDQTASKNSSSAGDTIQPRDLNSVIGSVLEKSHISDALHMVGGRPREIVRDTTASVGVDLEEGAVRSLFEEAIDRFASVAEDEDLLTVSTYQKEGYVYLDISRHRKNFPPVEQVAGFGEYQAAGEVLKHRPSDTYLEHASRGDCDYAFDRYTPSPSYLSFRFPVKKTATASIPTTASFPRVLAIDDQTVILDLISAMCQASGYQVTTASSGEEGLQLALRREFDIILTDLSMPGMSGLEVAREVKKSRPDVPIVLVTGWEVDIDRLRLTAAGITQVLYKPFRIEQLTEMIRSLTAARSR